MGLTLGKCVQAVVDNKRKKSLEAYIGGSMQAHRTNENKRESSRNKSLDNSELRLSTGRVGKCTYKVISTDGDGYLSSNSICTFSSTVFLSLAASSYIVKYK